MEGTENRDAVASQPAPSPLAPSQVFAFSSIFDDDGSAAPGAGRDGVSNADDDDDADDGKPAPVAAKATEGVTPTDAPKPGDGAAEPPKLSRREQERADHQAEIARLAAERDQIKADRDAAIEAARVEERDRIERDRTAAAERDAQSTQATQARAEAERYDRLCRTPDAELSGEDYQWREDRKALLAAYPEAQQHLQAEADRRIAARQAELEATYSGIDRSLREQIAASAIESGVDPKSWEKPGTTWLTMSRDIAKAERAAGKAEAETAAAARVEAAETEAERLRKENEDLRRGRGDGRPTPAVIGRSPSGTNGTATFDPNRGWRGNLRDAF